MLDKLSGVDKNSEVVKISVVDLISGLAKISVHWLQIRRNFSSRHIFMLDEISVVDWFSVVDYFSEQNDRRKFSSRLIFWSTQYGIDKISGVYYFVDDQFLG